MVNTEFTIIGFMNNGHWHGKWAHNPVSWTRKESDLFWKAIIKVLENDYRRVLRKMTL